MRTRIITAAIATAAVGFMFLAQEGTAQTADVRVLASNGVKAVMEALVPQAERAIGHPLAIQFNTSASLKQRIEGGEAFDVAVMTSDLIDDLLKQGKITAGTSAGVARSGIGVGIRTGAPKPDISTPESLKRTLLNARAITYAQDGASRVHILEMLDRFGITEAVKSKTILEQGSIRSTARVADGDAELVLTLVSEILPIKGIELAGPLPGELQTYVSLSAGVGAKAKNAAAAKALVKFLSSPAIAPTLKAKGMEPVTVKTLQ